MQWLNSPPLTAEALKGKVVLVDFWTYSCINCLRSLPYVKAWAEKYHDQGLVVIGVHAPEFAFERDVSNVTQAMKDLGITYPVAIDNNYYRFHARDLHLVLGPAADGKPVRFKVTIDGQAPGDAHGADIAPDGSGTVTEQRLYQLVRQPGAVQDRTFTIEFLDPQVSAYAFTFG